MSRCAWWLALRVRGLSRLVTENCDQIVSIPIDSAMESLNAAMAVGITLYDVSRRRASAN